MTDNSKMNFKTDQKVVYVLQDYQNRMLALVSSNRAVERRDMLKVSIFLIKQNSFTKKYDSGGSGGGSRGRPEGVFGTPKRAPGDRFHVIVLFLYV